MADTMAKKSLKLRYSHTVGIVAMEGRGFSGPSDLAIASDGRMYVPNRANPDQPYGVRIGVCNVDSEYFGHFGSYGTGDGQFVWPSAVACDSEDNVYLADEHLHRISVFDGSGTFLGKWGEQGAGEGRLNGPAGLCFDSDDNLYVADHLNNRVQVFSREGVFQRAWGGPGDGPGQLDLPWGVAVDTERNVFVADWGNDRVQKFSPDGRFLASFGSSGQGDGQFHRPSCVAVDAEGVLYVSDWGNERVQVLASDGGFIEKLRGQATPSKWADEFFEANPDEAAARARSNITPPLDPEVATAYEESARIEPYFWGPVSVKLDSQGRLYVTETNRHRIQVYETV